MVAAMRLAALASVVPFLSSTFAAGIPPVRRQETSSSAVPTTSPSSSSQLTTVPASTTSLGSAPVTSPSSASSLSSSSDSSFTSSSALTSSAPVVTSNTSSVATTTPIPSTVSATPAPSPTPVSQPSGGIGFNTTPTYKPQSDFDFQSLNLGLHQELIELDLFHHGLAIFNESDFAAAGLSEDDMFLIEFMADQEVGHATLISNILAPNITQQCTYQYPNFTGVRDFIDFCQKVTRFGESGTIGFLAHLDAQDTASLLMDSITTESRQQMVFRQFEGLFPMPFWFVPSITQSMQWTLLSPYISTCPAENPAVDWTIFPPLTILDNPYFPDTPLDNNTEPAITHNRTQATYLGREVLLSWEAPGAQTGFNGSFTTHSSAGQPQFAAWISQLNTTYTALSNITTANGTTNATTIQPGGEVYGNGTAALINGTVYAQLRSLPQCAADLLYRFLLVTDAAPYVTPYNLSEIEPHIVAGPALYSSG
ncbi:hypothetical protein BV25DRAFT_1372178 [Artomyces pyxidatus]|uniref:Uncharacterized protein n=1 Tax=Artomyces pyxidatus TaxID=48021 RepID=A0ACB8SN33_9AGAM|nr:hypothetical protein BV25DRAFT_1372178 [Artomyces pyxidatus]